MSNIELDLSNKVALITGASRGIGYHIALKLAKYGAHIIAMASSRKSLDRLAVSLSAQGANFNLVAMDLASDLDLTKLARDIYYKFGKLDILVGNAAILGELGGVDQFNYAAGKQIFNVNTMANWQLINAFAPLLYKAPAARALFVTSSVAVSSRPFWGPYAASKAALEVLIKCWAKENAHKTLRVNLLDPGATQTKMRATAFPHEDPNTCTHPSKIADEALKLLSPECLITGKCWVVKQQIWRD